MRLSFKPDRVLAGGGTTLTERSDLKEGGYTVQPLEGGDYVVRIHWAKRTHRQGRLRNPSKKLRKSWAAS